MTRVAESAGRIFFDACQDTRNSCVETTPLIRGARVRAVRKIRHHGLHRVVVAEGTLGRVQVVSGQKDRVGVWWDNGLLFFCPLEQTMCADERLRVLKPTLTKSEMLAFQSIFDLLTRLGFEEDTEGQRMVDRVICVAMDGSLTRDRSVDFDQIAGKTVAEFVREGLKTGLLSDYLKNGLESPVK